MTMLVSAASDGCDDIGTVVTKVVYIGIGGGGGGDSNGASGGNGGGDGGGGDNSIGSSNCGGDNKTCDCQI